MTYVLLLLLSVVSAILYRLGGASRQDQDKEFPWIPRWFKILPKKRDLGCGLACAAGMHIVGITAPWWIFGLCILLMWGALSTYWDPWFGYDNHYAHGFGVALALFPAMFFSEPAAIAVRILFLTLATGIWSKVNGNATIEELGRGFLIPITLAVALCI